MKTVVVALIILIVSMPSWAGPIINHNQNFNSEPPYIQEIKLANYKPIKYKKSAQWSWQWEYIQRNKNTFVVKVPDPSPFILIITGLISLFLFKKINNKSFLAYRK